MKRFTAWRRRPWAGYAVVLVALATIGVVYAGFSPKADTAEASNSAAAAKDMANGKQLFNQNCSSCHGLNAQGTKDEKGKQIAPSLIGVGAASVDFQVSTGRMPMQQPGAQNPTKPQTYSEQEIRALAAYVASLAPGPSIPDPADYSLAGLSEAERQEAVARGGQIFLTNCTACHNFAGKGGAMPRGGYAPALDNTEARHIYEAMLTGPGQMPSFSNGNLSPEEKRDVIAYLYSLREQTQYGGFNLGGLGPVSEGLFAWVVGIGSLVGFAVWIAAHTARTTRNKEEATV